MPDDEIALFGPSDEPQSGGLEFDWLSHHDFCERHLGVKYESGRLERIRLWSEIAKSCYWWAPYETTCFVSDRPTEIHLDARERLHNLREPAMAFSEESSVDRFRVLCHE
jgi:hypothetical protein